MLERVAMTRDREIRVMKEKRQMHFLRRCENGNRLVSSSCTLRLMHRVIVPEKRLAMGFFTEANVSASISGNPKTGNKMLQALSFGDRLMREINFNNLKIAR